MSKWSSSWMQQVSLSLTVETVPFRRAETSGFRLVLYARLFLQQPCFCLCNQAMISSVCNVAAAPSQPKCCLGDPLLVCNRSSDNALKPGGRSAHLLSGSGKLHSPSVSLCDQGLAAFVAGHPLSLVCLPWHGALYDAYHLSSCGKSTTQALGGNLQLHLVQLTAP